MNRKRSYVLAALAALVCMATGLTACSDKSEEVVVDNPNYNPETNEVNSQFVFAISTGNESTTRQSAYNVQRSVTDINLFRGIESTNILAYILDDDGKILTSSGQAAEKTYDLATILSSGTISENASNRVIELSLPLHTNTMLFYGKAIKDGSHREQGNIDFHVGSKPEDTYFRLRSRLSETEKFGKAEKLLEEVLSRVVDCGLHKETNGQERDFRYAFKWSTSGISGKEIKNDDERKAALAKIPAGQSQYNYKDTGDTVIYVGTLNWKDLGARHGETMTPLEEILSGTFHAFTNIDEGEVRAGSAAAVLSAISNLWMTNNKVADAIPTSPEEYMAKLLGQRLDTRFKNYFKSTEAGAEFLDINTITQHLKDYIEQDPQEFDGLDDETLKNFPVSLNLPMGAAQLNYDTKEGRFSYSGYEGGVVLGMGENTAITNIMWPAELCYFGNSPVRVTSEAKDRNSYPSTVAEWLKDDDTHWSGFSKNSHVQANTRAVAMQNDINYGNAMLESWVKINAKILKDNNYKIHKESDKEISTEGSASLFTLTGILVGGQNNEMGWNYLRKYNTDYTDDENNKHSASFNYVVYDNALTDNDGSQGIRVPSYGSESTKNYTLLFDNYTTDAKGQGDVYVALELVNNTGDGFYGANGLIRNGGTFYIVGLLGIDAATNNNGFSIPTGGDGHQIPPYGVTTNPKRIFIQDYVTQAEFRLEEESLKHAFVTVPDLRATNISLGMSVNLTWRSGLEYQVILGNSNKDN